jgi:sulfur carrier protein
MNILVNGEPTSVTSATTLQALIDTLDIEGTRYAIEINEMLIPRSEHATHQLQENDAVEVVQAIGGG